MKCKYCGKKSNTDKFCSPECESKWLDYALDNIAECCAECYHPCDDDSDKYKTCMAFKKEWEKAVKPFRDYIARKK